MAAARPARPVEVIELTRCGPRPAPGTRSAWAPGHGGAAARPRAPGRSGPGRGRGDPDVRDPAVRTWRDTADAPLREDPETWDPVSTQGSTPQVMAHPPGGP